MVASGCLEGRGRLCKETMSTELPGSPVAKTLRFHCGGHERNPWSGGSLHTMLCG